MKRILFILTGLALTFTLAQAQRGQNNYQRGNNGYQTSRSNQGNHGQNKHAQQRRGGNQGYNHGNQGYVRGGNQGTVRGGNQGTVRGGNRGTVRGNRSCTTRNYGSNNYYGGNRGGAYYSGRHDNYQPRQRVRWENSSCGTFRYRIVDNGTWCPGRWVIRRGCRTWIGGSWSWRRSSRNAVYATNGYYR